MVIKYENGKIYKIIGNVPTDPCYVGSTTKHYLSQRLTKHVNNYKNWKKGNKEDKIMSFELFDKYGIENCKIILLETVEAKSKDELRQREQHYIDQLECVNKQIAITTREIVLREKKEYYQNNKDLWHKHQILNYHCTSCDYELRLCKKSRHDKTDLHFRNTLKYMKSTIDKYTEENNMESNIIQHFSLE